MEFERKTTWTKPFLEALVASLGHSTWGRAKYWGNLMVVKRMRPAGAVHVNKERLDNLYVQLGVPAADGVVSRTMEELAVRLSRVETCYKNGQLDDMQKAARSMIAISEQIGMETFARVASDVNSLAKLDDGAALAATVDRLMRIGENSLLALWDLQGASI